MNAAPGDDPRGIRDARRLSVRPAPRHSGRMTAAPTAPAPTAPTSAPTRGLYVRAWRSILRDLGFLLPLAPVTIVASVTVFILLVTGASVLVLVFGIVIVVAALFAARGFGMFELLRLRGAGRARVTPPAWDRVARRSGWFAKLFAPVIDGHYWLYVLHTLIVNPIVGFFSWLVTFVWLTIALSGISFWAWAPPLAREDPSGWVEDVLTALIGGPIEISEGWVLDSVASVVVGLLFLAVLPLVTRGLTTMHYGIARGMLGAFRSEDLAVQVQGLSASRTAAAAAEGTALRRLERDIHDGPQQRLVRLQMDLAAVERQMDDDPDAARTLLSEAMQQSREALDELRAVSRGFAPPLLLDRGLRVALDALVSRCPVRTDLIDELPDPLDLPMELERNTYFIAAEALTNVAKHSGAETAELRVGMRRIPETDATWLAVTVTDDGTGGASAVPGHGIAGLDERVRGLGGTLEISSPAGGPTVLTASIPVTR